MLRIGRGAGLVVPPMCADALRLRPSGVRRAGADARDGSIPARYRGPDDAADGCPSGPGNCGLAPRAARCLFHPSPVLVPVIAPRTFRFCPQSAIGTPRCQSEKRKRKGREERKERKGENVPGMGMADASGVPRSSPQCISSASFAFFASFAFLPLAGEVSSQARIPKVSKKKA